MTLEPATAALLAELGGRTRAFVAGALRYWEARRVFFNAILGLVVAGHVMAGWPSVQMRLSFDAAIALFVLAVLANLCYCAVYAGDLFLQLSGIEEAVRVGRALLLGVGTAFAAALAHLASRGIFGI